MKLWHCVWIPTHPHIHRTLGQGVPTKASDPIDLSSSRWEPGLYQGGGLHCHQGTRGWCVQQVSSSTLSAHSCWQLPQGHSDQGWSMDTWLHPWRERQGRGLGRLWKAVWGLGTGIWRPGARSKEEELSRFWGKSVILLENVVETSKRGPSTAVLGKDPGGVCGTGLYHLSAFYWGLWGSPWLSLGNFRIGFRNIEKVLFHLSWGVYLEESEVLWRAHGLNYALDITLHMFFILLI